jgi:hypothetical protein
MNAVRWRGKSSRTCRRFKDHGKRHRPRYACSPPPLSSHEVTLAGANFANRVAIIDGEAGDDPSSPPYSLLELEPPAISAKVIAPAIGAYTGGFKCGCSEGSRWRGWVLGCVPCGRAVRRHSKHRRRPRCNRIRDGATRTRTPRRAPAHPGRPLLSNSASGARSRPTIPMPGPGRSAVGPTITPATCRRVRAGTTTATRPCGASHAAPPILLQDTGEI